MGDLRELGILTCYQLTLEQPGGAYGEVGLLTAAHLQETDLGEPRSEILQTSNQPTYAGTAGARDPRGSGLHLLGDQLVDLPDFGAVQVVGCAPEPVCLPQAVGPHFPGES